MRQGLRPQCWFWPDTRQNIQIAETGEVTADTPASLAERYVQGLYVRSNVAAGRSVLSQEYPELLYEMELEDKDGNAVVFADLGEDENCLLYTSPSPRDS